MVVCILYTKTHKKELSMSDKLQKLLSEKDRKMNAEELAFLAASFRETMFSTLHARGTGTGAVPAALQSLSQLYTSTDSTSRLTTQIGKTETASSSQRAMQA